MAAQPIILSEHPEVVETLRRPVLRFKTEAEIQAERILDSWEDDRNRALLREFNGHYCANVQNVMLHDSNFFAREDETDEEFEGRLIMLGLKRKPDRGSRQRKSSNHNERWQDFRFGWVSAGLSRARGCAGKGQ